MLQSGKLVLGMLALVLAGCTSPAPRFSAPAPDWQSQNFASITPVIRPPLVPPKPAIEAPDPFPETWIPLNRWCKANGLEIPARWAVMPLPAFGLTTTNGTWVIRAGSQVATWNGCEFHLGFTPQLIDGQPFVHSVDMKKTILPLLIDSPIALPGTNRTIVIDPGHGGENAGTRSALGNHYEKEFTLDWARRLQALLAARGWRSFLTRTNDTDLALSNRVAFADAHQADLFLSLHFNSAGVNEAQAGLETYCLTPTGMPSTVTREFGDDPSLVFPNNRYDPQNLQLAARVHRALLEVNGQHDRGVHRARYLGVLRGQLRPAILIEGGYLSNRREARLIADPAYRQRLAEAVARAVAEQSAAHNPLATIQGPPPPVQSPTSALQSSDSGFQGRRSLESESF